MKKKGHFVIDDIAGISLLSITYFKNNKGPIVLLTSNLYKAQLLYDFILTFINQSDVLLFPGDELIRAETVAESKELLSARVFTLNQLKYNQHKIIITNIAGICRYLPQKEVFFENNIEIKIGDIIDIESLKRKLVNSGYSRVSKVNQSLQFAIRGDIIDIYSINLDNPIRIELFGEEVDSIRLFDIATQISSKKIDEVEIIPARDFILTDEEIAQASEKIYAQLEKDQKVLDYPTFERLRNSIDNDMVDILEGASTSRSYKYFSFLTNHYSSLLNYLDEPTLVYVDDDAIDQSDKLLQDESFHLLEEMFEEGKIISHLEMYRDLTSVVFNSKCHSIKTSVFLKHNTDITFACRSVPYITNKESDAVNIIHNYLNDGYLLQICLHTSEQLNLISELLYKEKIPMKVVSNFELPEKGTVNVMLLSIPRGFVLNEEKYALLSSSELFNEKIKTSRFDTRFKKGTIIKNFEELEPGDYIVHEYHGIGQFLELQTLEIDGMHRDYLKCAYFGGEILYVPLAQFQLVRKYQGKEGSSPRLSHLHGKDWENTKKKIKEKINDLANRLYNLYVERSKQIGYAFQEDDTFQKQFEDQCEFELTEDQKKAVMEIKNDMQSTHPMDRLLCGDVGFGKTEVAFRAIFKAISSGKQVAMLCPTTLLARQHYENALERFKGFDIKIAVFSRLISAKDQKKYMEGLKDGTIHLAIGTHRLLSEKIVFKDLGLLVIDEEQRFGVEQKEKLKELKRNVDVLTLSATPIPRTLQMSLLGVRSLSQIQTAPVDRMPIQTYVIPYKFEICKELIERELGRGGQVFYMHNNISTLYTCASRLQKALPDITIGVVHGQMDKEDLEEIMMNYYNGLIDVLVCTSIIENGIDIPNANTIIVEDSERYGLSQLYQIKGRVGRSDRIAYAYLMFSEHKMMNEKVQKRLKAIQDFTELGSGYRIAQRDLMIRGAGDILGPEQAGYIDSIGLDLYLKLLNEAVLEKVEGTLDKPVDDVDVTKLAIKFDAYIPEEYASDPDKIELYQEIISASSNESLLALKRKVEDIYGKLPESVELVFSKRSIELLIKESNVLKVDDSYRYVEITLGEPYINIRGIGNILFETLIPYLNKIKVRYAKQEFQIMINKGPDVLSDLEGILHRLITIKKTNKTVEIK